MLIVKELRRVDHERGKDRRIDCLDRASSVRLSDADTNFPLGRLHELSELFLLGLDLLVSSFKDIVTP